MADPKGGIQIGTVEALNKDKERIGFWAVVGTAIISKSARNTFDRTARLFDASTLPVAIDAAVMVRKAAAVLAADARAILSEFGRSEPARKGRGTPMVDYAKRNFNPDGTIQPAEPEPAEQPAESAENAA